jgi:hypothetical protein
MDAELLRQNCQTTTVHLRLLETTDETALLISTMMPNGRPGRFVH